jgi:ACS family pantothenate transporter-like MFS transporter
LRHFLQLADNDKLSIWPATNSAKFAGFFLNFTVTPIGAILFAWANEILSESAESRAIVTGSLNTIAYTFNAWAPNLIWPASQAPVYKAGYKVAVGLFTVWLIGVSVIIYLQRYHPVTKYREAYRLQEEEQNRTIENVDDEKDEGISVPPSLPIAAQAEGGMAR